MKTSQPFIVFSVYLDGDNDNVHRHTTVREFLDAELVPYVECLGVYKGQSERSFLVADTDRGRAIADNAAASYGQESILLVDANKNAELVYRDGTRESIGTWRTVARGETPDSYTEHNGTKYTCS